MRRGSGRRVWRLRREGTPNGDPAQVTSRTDQFQASWRRWRATTVVTVRTDEGLEHYLLAPRRSGADAAALHLAHAVGARLEQADGAVPDLRCGPAVVALRFAFDATPTHSTQAGVDLSELSRSLAGTLQVGDWVAMVCRAPRWGERRRWNTWLSFRMSTPRPIHHSTRPKAGVVNVYAGSADVASARGVADTVGAGLPGFDVLTKARRPDRLLAPLVVLLAGAVAAFVVGAVSGAWSLAVSALWEQRWAEPLFTVGSSLTAAGVTMLGALVLALALVTNVVPLTRYGRVQRGLRTSDLPLPRSRWWPPRRPRRFSTTEGRASSDRAAGDYPLYPTCHMVGGTLPAALVAPQSGALSGSESTGSGHAPVAVTGPIGPRLGVTSFGEVTHLSARDLTRGVAVFGSPGVGKSVLTRNLTTWMSLERVRPSGRPGFPGADNTVVVFATKPDDMARTVAACRGVGDRVVTIEMADPDPRGRSIDLFAVPGTVADRAEHFVNALIYHFGEVAIGNESKRSLKAVIAGGLVIDESMARQVDRVEVGRSAVYYADVLLGNRSRPADLHLAAQVRAAAEDPAHPAHAEAVAAWSVMEFMFAPEVTKSARESFQKAPGNKWEQVAALDHYFAPTRRTRSWRRLLEDHAFVVLATGQSASGHLLEASSCALMGALHMFSLRHNIERTCAGWEERGRFVSIVADELVELVGASPEVVNWLRERGRSYGVVPVLATQNPLQISEAVRHSLMSYASLIAFKQDTAVLARPLAEDLSLGDESSGWSVGGLMNLEQFHAAVRCSVNGKRQSPFVVRTDFYDEEPEPGRYLSFARDQPPLLRGDRS